jgi:DNA repair protein RecO (recombination protein O)
MLHKTRGIVFRLTKYAESSIIVTIFTESFGLQSYIVNGVRSKSSKNQIALYQPLTLVDLVVYHRENAGLLRIKEIKCLYAYQTIHLDIRKSAIAMFLNEVVNKAIKDQSHTEEIGEFLITSFMALDAISSPENFHLTFLLKLSRYLGFGPQTNDEVLDGWPLDREEAIVLKALLEADYQTTVPMNFATRRILLEALLHFYARHTENFGEIKSIQVLKEMFN